MNMNIPVRGTQGGQVTQAECVSACVCDVWDLDIAHEVFSYYEFNTFIFEHV